MLCLQVTGHNKVLALMLPTCVSVLLIRLLIESYNKVSSAFGFTSLIEWCWSC